jgi:transposase-like protein
MKKQQCYTPEFRAEAVKLVTEQGLSQEAAAKRLGIPKGTIGNWVAAAKGSNRASVPMVPKGEPSVLPTQRPDVAEPQKDFKLFRECHGLFPPIF